jgi:hypothetical protein
LNIWWSLVAEAEAEASPAFPVVLAVAVEQAEFCKAFCL